MCCAGLVLSGYEHLCGRGNTLIFKAPGAGAIFAADSSMRDAANAVARCRWRGAWRLSAERTSRLF